MTAPLLYIDPPIIESLRYGLFGAAQPVTPRDENGEPIPHWRFGGIEFESLASFIGAGYPMGYLEAGGAGGTKTLPDGQASTKAQPFALYAGIDCGTIGRPTDEYRTRALEVLALNAQGGAEDALWTGAFGNTPKLNATADSAHITLTAAGSVRAAVAALEGYMAAHYNGKPLLHARRQLAPFAQAEQQIVREFAPPDEAGAREDWLTTPLANRWVFGQGYDGTGPGASAPSAGKEWIYATGQVIIIRDDPLVPADFDAAINRTLNRNFLIAEQPYLLAVDGPIVACQATLT